MIIIEHKLKFINKLQSITIGKVNEISCFAQGTVYYENSGSLDYVFEMFLYYFSLNLYVCT